MEITTVSPKVLIAEDEMFLARAIEIKLKQKGLEVDIASNGQMALQMVLHNAYALILLDILMPKLNGLEFMEELVQRNIEIPIIVASNLSREDEITKAKRLGAIEYFIKSETSLDAIVAMVMQHIGTPNLTKE